MIPCNLYRMAEQAQRCVCVWVRGCTSVCVCVGRREWCGGWASTEWTCLSQLPSLSVWGRGLYWLGAFTLLEHLGAVNCLQVQLEVKHREQREKRRRTKWGVGGLFIASSTNSIASNWDRGSKEVGNDFLKEAFEELCSVSVCSCALSGSSALVNTTLWSPF